MAANEETPRPALVRLWGAFDCDPPLSPAQVNALGDRELTTAAAGGVAPPEGEFCWEVTPGALIAPGTVVEASWDHSAWLHYLQVFVLAAWGVQLRGRVEWVGKDDPDEFGHITFVDGPPIVSRGARVYTELTSAAVLPKKWTTCITPVVSIGSTNPRTIVVAGLWLRSNVPGRPWHFEPDRAIGRPIGLDIREADFADRGWYSAELGKYVPCGTPR